MTLLPLLHAARAAVARGRAGSPRDAAWREAMKDFPLERFED